MKNQKYIRAALHEERWDLIDSIVKWLQREPKASINEAKRLYGLTQFEINHISNKLNGVEDEIKWLDNEKPEVKS